MLHIHILTLRTSVKEFQRMSSLFHCKINTTVLAASPSLSSYAFSLKAFAYLFYLLAIRCNIQIQFNYCIAIHTLPQLITFIFLEKRDFRFSCLKKFPLAQMDFSFICCWSILSVLIWINTYVLNILIDKYLNICTREKVTVVTKDQENNKRELKRQPRVFEICLCGKDASVWGSSEI